VTRAAVVLCRRHAPGGCRRAGALLCLAVAAAWRYSWVLMNATVQHQMLTPAEVAVELRVSAPTIYRRIAAGELKAVRVGGQLRIDRDDLERYLHAAEPERLASQTAPSA
jgi:excisionase family DNA binding protein